MKRATSKTPTKPKTKAAVVVGKTSTTSIKTSKTEQVLTLLRGKTGASVDQIMQLTGWQAHSVRGFMSGTIRKKYGLTLNVHICDGVRHYQIEK